MARASVLALAAVALLTTLSAGCAGGDDRLSRAELERQANDICSGYQRKLDALEQSQDFDTLQRFAEDARPILEQGVDDLRGLRPPEELEADYTAWVDATARDLVLIERVRKAAGRQDAAAIQRLSDDVSRADARADGMALALGLDVCAG
jgi:hypothetical protein